MGWGMMGKEGGCGIGVSWCGGGVGMRQGYTGFVHTEHCKSAGVAVEVRLGRSDEDDAGGGV